MKRKTVSIDLEQEIRREIKLKCAFRGWSMAHFYEEAMRMAVARFKASERNKNGYRLRELPEEGLARTSIWVDSQLAKKFDFLKGAGIMKRAAYYTAIHDYLEKLEEETDER